MKLLVQSFTLKENETWFNLFFPLLHVACHFLLESLPTKEKILTNPKIQLPDYNKKKEKQHVEQHNLHLHQPYIATRGLKPKDHLCTFLNVCCILKLRTSWQHQMVLCNQHNCKLTFLLGWLDDSIADLVIGSDWSKMSSLGLVLGSTHHRQNMLTHPVKRKNRCGLLSKSFLFKLSKRDIYLLTYGKLD